MGYMCGRFAVTTDPALLAEKIPAIDESAATKSATEDSTAAPTTTSHRPPPSAPSSNGTPTGRRVDATGAADALGAGAAVGQDTEDGGPDTKGPLLINARSEKVTTSPVFRTSAKAKRCLVPMDGWYEWRPNARRVGQEGAQDAVLHVRRRRRDAVHGGAVVDVAAQGRPERRAAAAELHDHHHRCRGTAGRDPRPDAADHQPEDWDRWLDPDAPIDEGLLRGHGDLDRIEIREVSRLVNSIRNNGPELIEPAKPEPEQATLL